jgi:hypothetical protein
MVLGAPAALWWLLLVPLVVLLYMLRARREMRVVPSTVLWERATRDLVARIPVRRLERNLLLLLQVLAISTVALALARPSLALPGLSGDAAVIVIRTTASMQATDVAPSRFAAAQRDALAFIATLGLRQPLALLASGPRPVIVHDFTTDRAALTAALQALRPSDAGGALDEAVALAASLRVDGRPVQVHVFSDRSPAAGRAQWHRVGTGAANMAVTAASVRPGAAGGTRLLVRVETFGASAAPRTLVVTLDGRAVAQRVVRPSPANAQAVVVDLGNASGLVTVQLRGRDALAADDRAVVPVGREALPRVLVVGQPNPVLDAVLRAIPLAGVTRADRIAPGEWGRADLVVLDGLDPLALPPGAYVLVDTLAENLPLQIEGTVRDQTVRTVAATHRITRLADLRGVRVASAIALRLQGGEVLAEGDVPLAWAYEGRGLRAVMLPFGLSQTDLPLHPAFPVLIANAVNWLTGGPEVAPGESPLVAAGARTTGTLLDPTGRAVAVEARDGLFILPPLDRVGVWRLRAEGWERRWIVSTVGANESDLTMETGPAPPAPASVPQPAYVSLVAWLVGAAAVLIAGEWFLWARTVPPDYARRRLK